MTIPNSKFTKTKEQHEDREHPAAHHFQGHKEAASGATNLLASPEHNGLKPQVPWHCLFTKTIRTNDRMEENSTTASHHHFLQPPSLSAGRLFTYFACFYISSPFSIFLLLKPLFTPIFHDFSLLSCYFFLVVFNSSYVFKV